MREIYGIEARRGEPRWTKVALVALVAAVAVLAFLWVSPYGDQILGRGVVYVSGINETAALTFQGTTQNISGIVVPPGAPMRLMPGQSFSLSWLIENPYSNRTVTYTALAVGPGWSGSVSPSAPLALNPFQTARITLDSSAPSTAGSYFVPLTVSVSVS